MNFLENIDGQHRFFLKSDIKNFDSYKYQIDDEIKNAIEGNLCRCTGYQQIVDSVRSASKILTSGNENLNGTEPLSNPNPGFVK